MAAMLGCWASQGDNPNAPHCAKFADALKMCMSSSVRVLEVLSNAIGEIPEEGQYN